VVITKANIHLNIVQAHINLPEATQIAQKEKAAKK